MSCYASGVLIFHNPVVILIEGLPGIFTQVGNGLVVQQDIGLQKDSKWSLFMKICKSEFFMEEAKVI
jgi:hypothetical protein